MRVLLSGASGLIGSNLLKHTITNPWDFWALARTAKKIHALDSDHILKWEHDSVPNLLQCPKLDAVVNLAGEGIADHRWTEQRKKRLRDSRIVGTRNLIKAIQYLPESSRPNTLISVSASGYYGDCGDHWLNESHPNGTDFLAQLCHDWELEALKASDLGVRVVIFRLGLVLSKDGGFLSKIGPVYFGNGKDWKSWVHIDDVVGLIYEAVQNPNLAGAYNLTSPSPLTSHDLLKQIQIKKRWPIIWPIPKKLLFLALGELASALLNSQRMTSKRLVDAGYKFKYPNITEALNSIYS